MLRYTNQITHDDEISYEQFATVEEAQAAFDSVPSLVQANSTQFAEDIARVTSHVEKRSGEEK